MGNRLVRHTGFFRALTIAGAAIGLASGSAFATFMTINAVKGNFIVDELREYTASFYSEGALVEQATYKRGEEIVIPQVPEHEMDGEGIYIPLGWDILGNGVPDFIPPRIYSNIKANAVYFKIGGFDLSFLDLSNMDLQTLLELMDKLNIDWEQFMDMFNIDPETLMKWLQQQVVLTFTTNSDGYLTYFRQTSYGDYNYAKKSYNAPDYYDSSRISPDSVNPLSFTADKLNQAYSMSDQLPSNFDFSTYDITFATKQDYYPVPDCEHADSVSEIVDSDAHYITQAPNNFYSTYAAYVPAMKQVIDILSFIPFSNSAIMKDERSYYKYALEKYTTIPTEYEEIIDGIINKNKWLEGDYSKIDNIGAYVENLGKWNIFNDDGSINISPDKNKDPVNGLITNEMGSDLDFNTVACMICRRLQIPARIVKGYWWSPMMSSFMELDLGDGTHSLTLLNQRYWCEIYVKNIGWMIFDTVNVKDILGTNPYGDLDKESTPFDENHILDHIEVETPEDWEIYLGENIDPNDITITAFFQDDTSNEVPIYDQNLQFDGFDPTEIGEQTVTVTYTYEGVSASDTFTITIKKRDSKVVRIEYDFSAVKKKFYQGETFTDKNIVATAYFDDPDDPIQDVSALVHTDGGDIDMNVRGTYWVNAWIESDDINGLDELDLNLKTDSYQISVEENVAVDIQVVTPPTDTSYFTGETFDPEGLSVEVTYENGQKETFTYGDPDWPSNIGFLQDDGYGNYVPLEPFDEVNPDFPVVVGYNNDTGMDPAAVVEVEVNFNNISSYDEVEGFIDEYEIGDVFDIDSFDENGTIKVTLANGDEMTFTKSDITDVGTPNLGEAGAGTVPVTFTYEDVEYEVDVPITVKNVDSDSFAISSKVSTAGPKSGNISGSPIFSYTTDYVGTMYFRNASYSTYDPKTGWRNSNSTMYNFNPNGFVYDKASQVHVSSDVTITYNKNMPNGVAPVYPKVTNSGYDEIVNSDQVVMGDSQTYTATNFALTTENVNRLRSINYSSNSSINQVYNSYSNSVTNPSGKYLQDTSNAGEQIEQYIMLHGYPNYDTFSDDDIDNKLGLIKEVESDLKTFTYDINFAYRNPAQDPIVSFLQEGRGICNNFASTATMIYRRLGIPARFVTGFASNSTGGMSPTEVSPMQAHAWTEVWLDKVGWIIIDATGYAEGGGIPTGDYGGSPGGGGIYNVPKIVFGGNVELSYDYSKAYDDYEESGNHYWVCVFDNKDHHSEIVDPLVIKDGDEVCDKPTFLDFEVVFFMDVDGDGIKDDITEDGIIDDDDIFSSDKVKVSQRVNVGSYTLIPELRVIDNSLPEDEKYVTDQYEFHLVAPGTDHAPNNMEYMIFPATIVVEINPDIKPEDCSISKNNGDPLVFAQQWENVVLVIVDKNSDNPFADMVDPMPNGVSVILNPHYECSFGDPGVYYMVWDSLEDPYVIQNTDPDNLIIIVVYGEVEIIP